MEFIPFQTQFTTFGKFEDCTTSKTDVSNVRSVFSARRPQWSRLWLWPSIAKILLSVSLSRRLDGQVGRQRGDLEQAPCGLVSHGWSARSTLTLSAVPQTVVGHFQHQANWQKSHNDVGDLSRIFGVCWRSFVGWKIVVEQFACLQLFVEFLPQGKV